MTKFLKVLILTTLGNQVTAQYLQIQNEESQKNNPVFYYNVKGELTIKEFAINYRIGELNSSKGHFLGNIEEYDINGKKISELTYDSNGKIKRAILFKPDGGKLKKLKSFPDSIKIVLENKSNLIKSEYIRLGDFGDLKFIISPESDSSKQIYDIVEVEPTFYGGWKKMKEILWEYFLVYPQSAKNNNVEGVVYIEFIIQENGQITQARIQEGFDKECDKAALEAFKKLPDFIPGRQRGRNVAVRRVYPIKFEL